LVLVADDREEFQRIGGFYGTGYRSELRKGLYHGRGDISNKDWQKEIRRLYHLIKDISSELKLPHLREHPQYLEQPEQPETAAKYEGGDDDWMESKYELACLS
jgi:hypothetical protein